MCAVMSTFLATLEQGMNIAAFLGSHFGMIGIKAPWAFVPSTSTVFEFGVRKACILYAGDAFGPYDSLCGVDIAQAEDGVPTVKTFAFIAFILFLFTFVQSNWFLTNRFVSYSLVLTALGATGASLYALLTWFGLQPQNLPEDALDEFGAGLIYEAGACLMGIVVLVCAIWRLFIDRSA
jgi:hypothetical protein